MADLVNAPLPYTQSPAASAAGGQDAGVSMTDVEQELNHGYAGLRFSAPVEARFVQDKSAERLKRTRTGVVLMMVLTCGLLMADWWMAPDQFGLALTLRVGLFTPVALVLLLGQARLSPALHEWSLLILALLVSCPTLILCLRSTDPLAAPYLASLALMLMFNGGVIRMRFWLALRIDGVILALLAAALQALPGAPAAVMTSMTLVVVSATVFTLYGTYWLERRERRNWLLLQQEHVLMGALDQANRRLDQVSRLDPLTELANRRHFDQFLHQVWSRARQDGQELALLMIDIDHFKRYNDHYGHPAGDVCLKEVAATLKRHLRKPGDLVARLGGEEFIAVLTNTSLPLALAAAERVRLGMVERRLPHAAAPDDALVTVSIGVASVRPAALGASPSALIAQVDGALYRAKLQGRNQVVAAAAAPEG